MANVNLTINFLDAMHRVSTVLVNTPKRVITPSPLGKNHSQLFKSRFLLNFHPPLF